MVRDSACRGRPLFGLVLLLVGEEVDRVVILGGREEAMGQYKSSGTSSIR